MKRTILILITVALAVLIVYRFVDQRRVASMETINTIQAKQGFPVEVVTATTSQFTMVKRYTGSVVGGEEAAVVPMIGEYIEEVLVKQGQRVKADQVMFKLARTNPTARYQAAKLAAANAETELKRIQTLFDQGAVSKQMLDGATLGNNLSQDALRTSENLLDIKASIDGVITELTGEVGHFAVPGMPLAKIISDGQLRVKVLIPAVDRDLVKVGTKCDLRANSAIAEGRIERVDLSANVKDRSFQAWITIVKNPNSTLFSPGLLIDAELNVINIDQAVTVPPEALIRSGDGWHLYVVEGSKATIKKVEVGGRNTSSAWVSSGLISGQNVVISGANLLYDNALIRIITRK